MRKPFIIGAIIVIALLIYLFSFCQITVLGEVQERIRDKYSKEELMYFFETVYGNEVERGYTDRLLKWNSDIRVKLHGDYELEDSLHIALVIGELNDLIEPIDLELVDYAPDVSVHFIAKKRFKNINHGFADQKFGAFTYSRWPRSLRSASVVIDKTILDKDFRRHLIREELTQCLGLFFDSYTYPKSIFQQDQLYWNLPYDTIDIKLIQLLYNEGLPSGLHKESFEKYFLDKKEIP